MTTNKANKTWEQIYLDLNSKVKIGKLFGLTEKQAIKAAIYHEELETGNIGLSTIRSYTWDDDLLDDMLADDTL